MQGVLAASSESTWGCDTANFLLVATASRAATPRPNRREEHSTGRDHTAIGIARKFGVMVRAAANSSQLRAGTQMSHAKSRAAPVRSPSCRGCSATSSTAGRMGVTMPSGAARYAPSCCSLQASTKSHGSTSAAPRRPAFSSDATWVRNRVRVRVSANPNWNPNPNLPGPAESLEDGLARPALAGA
eukprot:scaffold98380_cov75-Phaeocystis_antarctica.AAC.3